MSFFDDEDDEPPPNPRQASSRPRPSARRRPTGSATHQQQVQTRRIVAGVVVVVLIIIIVLLVNSCSVSANKNSLTGYAGNVYSIIGNSDTLATTMFADLDSGQGQSALQTDLNDFHIKAQQQLQAAERLSVPGSMARAQTNVVQALRERYDGIGIITNNLATALSSKTASDGVRKIAQGMAYLYASDVEYKGYAAPAIASALHGASLPVTGKINSGQFVPDLGWLQQKFIATKIGAQLSPAEANQKPVPGGLYGHQLTSVSVNGTTLVAGGAINTIPASPAPTFVLSLTNGGHYNEFDVGCQVSIKNLSDTGTHTIPETTAGESTTCSVTLPKPPTTGTWQVVATIKKVPGETNVSNNTATYTVNFTS
jgi:hypothetical protein